MGSATRAVDLADLSLFSPLDQLAPAQAERLLEHSRVERIPPGRRLFDIGDSDGRSIFLLAGQLALVSADNRIHMLKAATPEAGQAIANRQPREAAALARTAATIFCVDTVLLESLLTAGDATVPKTSVPNLDLGPIFASPLFSRLTGHGLQSLMQGMDILEARAGDVVLREGEENAWYHIVESGRFKIAHRRRARDNDEDQGELGRLQGFGEAALIANEPHEFSVIALEDGRLLRFPKGDFLNLILRPLIQWIGHNDIAPLMLKGSLLLDVRSHKAYSRHHLRDSINLPLRVLRQTAAILDHSRSYIICCDNVRRSAAAAFLLAQQGMEAKVLNDTVRNAMSVPRPSPIQEQASR